MTGDIEDRTNGCFKKEKHFECWIDEIANGVIYARGRDVDELGPEIIFELDINDVDENDRELIKESAVFMVKIGTIAAPRGQITNKIIIKFRRPKVITDLDLLKKLEITMDEYFKSTLTEAGLRKITGDKVFCGECRHLEPTEREQNKRGKRSHWCHEYNNHVKHYQHHPYLPRLRECLTEERNKHEGRLS